SSGASFSMTYNAGGLIDSITDSAGRTTRYQYDSNNTYLLLVTSPAGMTSYTYNTGSNAAQTNALLSITDSSGVTSFFGYDSQGRLVATHRSGDLQHITYTYVVGEAVATDASAVANKVFFDDRGLVLRTEDGLGNYLLYTYNDARQLIQQTDTLGNTISYT